MQAAHELLDLESRCLRDPDSTVSIVAGRDLNVAGGGLFHRPTNPYHGGEPVSGEIVILAVGFRTRALSC